MIDRIGQVMVIDGRTKTTGDLCHLRCLLQRRIFLTARNDSRPTIDEQQMHLQLNRGAMSRQLDLAATDRLEAPRRPPAHESLCLLLT